VRKRINEKLLQKIAACFLAVVSCTAGGESPRSNAARAREDLLPPEAKLRDGLQAVEMSWRDLCRHEVKTGEFAGAITLQAHLPENWQGEPANKLPIAFGIEVRFVFDLKSVNLQNRVANLSFSLTAPKSGRKWLKPFAESAKRQNLKYTLEDARLSFETPLGLNEAWWLTLPVTNATGSGDYEYEFAWAGAALARGGFAFFELPERERDALQRMITVYFFSRVAYPRFKAWVEEHDGRLPNIKEFMAELDNLEYFPANDYTARRGLPKRLDQIAQPEKTWLARECRPAGDGKVVVVYADGSIGLGEPLEAGDDRGAE